MLPQVRRLLVNLRICGNFLQEDPALANNRKYYYQIPATDAQLNLASAANFLYTLL